MRKKKLFNLLCSAALAAGMSMNTVLPAFADETVAQEESVETLYLTSYTGLLNKGNNHWEYVVNGTTQTGYTGLVNYYGTWYYVQNGILNWNYSGLTNYYGTLYYVQNGVMGWNYNGSITYNQTPYTIQNSVAYPASQIPAGAKLLQLGRRYSCWDDSDFIDTTMWGGHWNDMYYYTPVPQTININFIGRYSFFYIDRANGENYYTLTAIADQCGDPRFSDQIYLEAGTYVIKTSVGIFHAAGSMTFTITVKQ